MYIPEQSKVKLIHEAEVLDPKQNSCKKKKKSS